MEQIQETLSDIRALNAGKKRDEALELLTKWFPKVEAFETKVNRLKKDKSVLETENIRLADMVLEGREKRIGYQIEVARLKKEVTAYKRFYDAIPQEIKEHMKAMQKKPDAKVRNDDTTSHMDNH